MELQLREPAHRVSPKAPLVWCLGGFLTEALIAGAVVGAVVIWDLPVPLWLWVGYGVLAAIYLVAMPWLRWRTHRWETTDKAVYTQTGWLSRERRLAPMSRVQTVDFEQSALARAFGLASVTVTTASAQGPLHLRMLDRDVAERVVAELTHRANLETGDAT